jgi:Ca-activated chloride channel family protein
MEHHTDGREPMHRIPRLITALAVTALAVTLTGCTGADSASDSKGGAAAPYPGANAPNAAAPPDQQPTHVQGGGSTSTKDDPQSTFAVDVDTASYGYARRQILAGQRPSPSTIRPEEFVNAFDQDYPEPAGDGFAVHADGARLPEGAPAAGDVRLMRVGLQTRSEPDIGRTDTTLTFVVDTSGSMSEPGRLDLVRDALHTLVDQLRPTDAVAIVAFSSSARVVRDTTRLTDRAALHSAIDRLQPEANTNLEDGLLLGYRVARSGFRPGTSNRVVVLSDGLANTGSTDANRILDQVREEAAKQIALLGVGVGSDYGDALMERLADGGDGFVVYVSEPAQARDVFVRRLPATLAVRALDAKVQVTFDPSTVSAYRLIGYENRAVADGSFRNDRVDGGEVGPGHSVTALYEVHLARNAGRDAPAARVDVRWLDPANRAPTEASHPVRVADLDGAFASAAPRLWVTYCAASLAESLRAGGTGDTGDEARTGSGRTTVDGLIGIARSAAERTGDPAVAELADLTARAARLR